MKPWYLLLLSLTLLSCTKASSFHYVRVVSYAVDKTGEYTPVTNTVAYLNHNTCVCMPDINYGYNTNPTFDINNVEDGAELHILSFINAGEEIQYKTIRVYVDGKVAYNGYNLTNIDAVVQIR